MTKRTGLRRAEGATLESLQGRVGDARRQRLPDEIDALIADLIREAERAHRELAIEREAHDQVHTELEAKRTQLAVQEELLAQKDRWRNRALNFRRDWAAMRVAYESLLQGVALGSDSLEPDEKDRLIRYMDRRYRQLLEQRSDELVSRILHHYGPQALALLEAAAGMRAGPPGE